ncbi:MAG: hypothetical protein N2257_03250 [Thermodesulfovibrionales bacterium]|nr:hypothetical protein [Thermodesulfovibrionales bacterium]
MINIESIREYVKRNLQGEVLEFRRLGSGVHGEGFLLKVKEDSGIREYVIKDLAPHDLGHDYPADRASVFLLAYDSYNQLPKHVRAVDVLQLKKDKTLTSIKDGVEYYLLMDKACGVNYFKDLEEMKDKTSLNERDRNKIKTMVNYLAEIHSLKPEIEPNLKRSLYLRKLRDTIGHGECLMGVFDTYPEGTLSYKEMEETEILAIPWRYRLRNRINRLCQIHGDFHPGNIWFRDGDFILLDRSRGPWGEAADDITALTVNYIFFSIKYHGLVKSPYTDALELFYNEYMELTGDRELLSTVQPFYAFRAAVVGNPVFYPDLTPESRRAIFNFMKNILKKDIFEPDNVNQLTGGAS